MAQFIPSFFSSPIAYHCVEESEEGSMMCYDEAPLKNSFITMTKPCLGILDQCVP